MLSWNDLTPTEQRLCAAAADGQPLDLTTGQADEDDPARAQHWQPDRSIRASLLYQLLSGRGELDTTCGPPLRVQIRGAHIAGPLTLTHLTLRCPLELRDCHLESDVDLTKAIGSDLSLAGSHLHGTLQGRRLRLDHDLDLNLVVCSNGVYLPGARIGGVLDCSGAELTNDTGPALAADGLTVDGSVFLRNGFTATGSGQLGAVRLLGAQIKGPLECTGATLTNENGPALIADGLTVEGVFLAYGFTAVGQGEQGAVRLFGARVGGQLACPGAHLSNDSGPALYADRLTVGDGMFLAHGFIAVGHGEQGAVRLLGARVGGQIVCLGARLSNDSGPALVADGLTVDGDLILSEGFTAVGHSERGAVELLGAHISGQLDCSGAYLRNGGGPALSADRLTVGGGMFLAYGFIAAGHGDLGAVRLPVAHIGAQYDCSGALLSNDSGPALVADGLTVDGDLILSEGFTAIGKGKSGAAVELSRANVSRAFLCTDATLTNQSGPVLSLHGASFGRLVLSPTFASSACWSVRLSQGPCKVSFARSDLRFW